MGRLTVGLFLLAVCRPCITAELVAQSLQGRVSTTPPPVTLDTTETALPILCQQAPQELHPLFTAIQQIENGHDFLQTITLSPLDKPIGYVRFNPPPFLRILEAIQNHPILSKESSIQQALENIQEFHQQELQKCYLQHPLIQCKPDYTPILTPAIQKNIRLIMHGIDPPLSLEQYDTSLHNLRFSAADSSFHDFCNQNPPSIENMSRLLEMSAFGACWEHIRDPLKTASPPPEWETVLAMLFVSRFAQVMYATRTATIQPLLITKISEETKLLKNKMSAICIRLYDKYNNPNLIKPTDAAKGAYWLYTQLLTSPEENLREIYSYLQQVQERISTRQFLNALGSIGQALRFQPPHIPLVDLLYLVDTCTQEQTTPHPLANLITPETQQLANALQDWDKDKRKQVLLSFCTTPPSTQDMPLYTALIRSLQAIKAPLDRQLPLINTLLQQMSPEVKTFLLDIAHDTNDPNVLPQAVQDMLYYGSSNQFHPNILPTLFLDALYEHCAPLPKEKQNTLLMLRKDDFQKYRQAYDTKNPLNRHSKRVLSQNIARCESIGLALGYRFAAYLYSHYDSFLLSYLGDNTKADQAMENWKTAYPILTDWQPTFTSEDNTSIYDRRKHIHIRDQFMYCFIDQDPLLCLNNYHLQDFAIAQEVLPKMPLLQILDLRNNPKLSSFTLLENKKTIEIWKD